MNPFAGKSSTERNKMIAAMVLGVLALGALFFAFGGPGIFSSGTKVTVTASPTPKSATSVPVNPDDFKLPSQSEQNLAYVSTVVDYRGVVTGPDPGRNIFAFYVPAKPTPYVPTPPPTPSVST